MRGYNFLLMTSRSSIFNELNEESVGYDEEEVVILLQLQSHSLCKSTHEMILPYFLASSSSHIHKHNARSTHRLIHNKRTSIFFNPLPATSTRANDISLSSLYSHT